MFFVTYYYFKILYADDKMLTYPATREWKRSWHWQSPTKSSTRQLCWTTMGFYTCIGKPKTRLDSHIYLFDCQHYKLFTFPWICYLKIDQSFTTHISNQYLTAVYKWQKFALTLYVTFAVLVFIFLFIPMFYFQLRLPSFCPEGNWFHKIRLMQCPNNWSNY